MTRRAACAPAVLCTSFVLLMGSATPSRGAWRSDPATNVALSTATGTQTVCAAVADGSGGMIVAWEDRRAGLADIYAQRVLADGSIAPGWPADGLAVRTALGSQLQPSLIGDGEGGAIITWRDGATNVYASRITGAGAVAPGWVANGTPVSTDFFFAVIGTPTIEPDGAGGALIAWGSELGPYVQRVDASGSVSAGWPAEGLALTASGYEPTAALDLVPDGSGGGIATWADFRNGVDTDIIAQRFTGAGAIAAGWPADGVTVCGAAGLQLLPVSATDGADGAIVAWWDMRPSVTLGPGDVYARRILASGALDPFWPVDGLAVSAAAGTQVNVRIVSDGTGGLLLAWNDARGGFPGPDIYAARVTGAGALGIGWVAGGTPVSSAAGAQTLPAVAGDGASGLLVAWQDTRAGIADIYAQRVDRWGRRGNPEPLIVSVGDVANDQGGRVLIRWSPSYLDPDPFFEIGEYWIWRQVPGAAAEQMMAGGRALYDPERSGDRPMPGAIVAIEQAQQQYYWEFLAARPASGLSGYSYVAETTSDSTSAGNPYTLFMVQARHATTIAHWSSSPDSGYSVDNLAPAPPAAFTAQYFPGSSPSGSQAAAPAPYIWFHWFPSPEADFSEYRLHGSTAPDFVPGPANLLVAKPDTGYVLTSPSVAYFKLLAIDVHGNASASAILTPQDIVGAPDPGLPTAVRLGPTRPNPVGERAVIHFDLPRPERISLDLFDPGGRRVAELAAGIWPAGRHDVTWAARGADGRPLASGLYLVRLVAGGKVMTARLAVVR